jgi:hypothetical protein
MGSNLELKRARRESWLAVSPVGDRVAQSRTLRRLNEAFHAGEDVHGRVRALIADSWARCSSAGLTARTQTDSVLDDREIEERWGDHLLRPLMPLLEELLSGATNEAAHLLAITDAQGIVLWKGGDREIVSATDEIAFVPGADWSERGAGTNAMGTAIAVDHQVQIFSAEHFSMDVHPWHCCAAPVHDPSTGELAAVIDLTGRLKTAHPHTLGLVTAAAGVAETYLRQDLAVHDERAKALFLARVTGTRERTALLRRNGEVVAAAPAGWTSGTVELPPTAAQTVALPGGATGELETLPGTDMLVLWRRPARREHHVAATPRARLVLAGAHPQITFMHQTHALSTRHAELLAVLALTGRELSAEELTLELYGETGKPSSVRGEVSRLRHTLGDLLQSRPYGFSEPVTSDLQEAEWLLESGDLARAVALMRERFLPRSEVARIVEARDRLEYGVGAAVRRSRDPDLLRIWCETAPGQEDQDAARELVTLLPRSDPRLPAAHARVRRLARQLS